MIIDAHCHPGEYKEYFSDELLKAFIEGGIGKMPVWWDPKRTWTEKDFYNAPPLIQVMDELGIDKTILFGQSSTTFNVRTSLDLLAKIVGKHPDRFVGVHSVDPIGGDKAVEEVERAIVDYGFKGIKLYPVYCDLKPDDARIFPVYAKAEELGVPVIVHMGFTSSVFSAKEYAPLAYQYPLLLDKIPAAFPDLKLVVAHFGNPWGDEVLLLMRKYPNVYADLAYEYFPMDLKAKNLVWAKFFGFLDRLMWGTDYPIDSPAESLEDMRRLPEVSERMGLEPVLTENDIKPVLGANAARLFGLEV